MNRFFRFIIAAWGAKKLGGGCLSTIVIFIVIYLLLGQCNQQSKATNKYIPAKTQAAVPICGITNK
jgi:hypothetical protein